MADYGINFRDTSDYVTDGAGETYCLGHTEDEYPVTRGGLTFGWTTSGGLFAEGNRNSGVDARFAGINEFVHSQGPATADFRVDLTGNITLRIAAGDYQYANTPNTSIRDEVGEKIDLGIITTGTTDWHDGEGTVRTSIADWISNNVAFSSYDFSGYVVVRMTADTGESGSAVIAHLFLSEDAADPTVPALDEGMLVGGLQPLAGGLA